MAASRNIRTALAGTDAQVAAEVVAAASDIAILIAENGTVQDVSIEDEELNARLGGTESWIGRPWSELLNDSSRVRGQALLAEAAIGQRARWRQLTHPGTDGGELPILYTAVVLDRKHQTLLLGRDQLPMTMLQQRLMDAREAIERDHARVRNLEGRWRMLLETSREAQLVIDAVTQRVSEANRAAHALFGTTPALVGRPVADLFEPRDRAALDEVLANARAGEGAELARIGLADQPIETGLRADAYRDNGTTCLLLRVVPAIAAPLPVPVPPPAAEPAERAIGRDLPRSVDQLTELIGRVPLRDLVREATDIIERLCIEAALDKTSDNRASAAELLGLSRQSLYVKLHRYGLGDLADVPS